MVVKVYVNIIINSPQKVWNILETIFLESFGNEMYCISTCMYTTTQSVRVFSALQSVWFNRLIVELRYYPYEVVHSGVSNVWNYCLFFS